MTCEVCSGTGAITDRTESENGTSLSSRLCACRASLPPRHGKVLWWTYGKGREEEMTTSDGMTRFGVRWTPELPVGEGNYPLVRTRDNCYFVGTIELAVENGPALTAAGLREIAAFLTRMADQIDKWDEPVADAAAPLTT